MRWLELRRHAFTKQGSGRRQGSQLSQAGVEQARAVGAALGPFAWVVASPVPRTLETALAMGFAVDDTADMDAGLWKPAQQEQEAILEGAAPASCAAYARLVAESRATAALARHQEGVWRAALARVPEGERALVVAHGGLLEPGLVACFPGADTEVWGAPFSQCEGARVGLDGGRFVELELRRL